MFAYNDDMVNNPSHYEGKNGMRVIDVIEEFTDPLTGVFATDSGNIIKYACRWHKKGTPKRDLKKIIWYATHLLEKLEESEVDSDE